VRALTLVIMHPQTSGAHSGLPKQSFDTDARIAHGIDNTAVAQQGLSRYENKT